MDMTTLLIIVVVILLARPGWFLWARTLVVKRQFRCGRKQQQRWSDAWAKLDWRRSTSSARRRKQAVTDGATL